MKFKPENILFLCRLLIEMTSTTMNAEKDGQLHIQYSKALNHLQEAENTLTTFNNQRGNNHE